MKNNKRILLFIFCVCAIQTFGQVLTIDSVLSRIESNNPMLKMYDEQINAANNYSEMAKSWMPPTFSTGPWQAPYKNFSDGMWMITGEQMIPNPAKQKANYQFMQGMASIEQQGKAAKKNEMFAMAKTNYYEWIVLQKKYYVLMQTDSLLNYIVQVAQNRFTFNKEKLNNIYKSQADLFELRNMEAMLVGDMKMKNIELNTLMNIDKSYEFDVDTSFISYDYELQLIDTFLITTSRSDIKQFDANIGLLKFQQQYEKSKRLPDFGISLSHMQSLGMMPNQYSAMGMMTIPIAPWATKEYKSNIKGLNNTLNAIGYQKQSLVNETAGKIASLQTQMKYSKQQLTNYTNLIIPTYFKSYETSMLAYEQNTEDLFVVLDALKMHRMAKMNELDQLNVLFKLQVEYEKELEIR
ncbi:MAG: TolC family protein [Bacteroidetes bacterium]|nr:TolC family protein [Bacteroidota bacterium]